MRLLISITLGAALAMATAAMAGQDQTNSAMFGGSGPSMVGFFSTGPQEPCCNGVRVAGTRYDTSLMILKAQMDYRAQLDGGHLTAKHAAEFQQALDDTNRHFHKGPYARP
jgi:hypothetical protein